MTMGKLNRYELAYPTGWVKLCRDENGIGELVFLYGDEIEERVTFKLKTRACWELFRRAWRVIRRKGSVQIVDKQYRLEAHIFATAGSMWEVTRP